MIVFYIISFLLFVTAIVILLRLTPETITGDMMKFVMKKPTLREDARVVQGRKKKNRVITELKYMKEALVVTGKGSQFTILIASALVLVVVGCVIAIAVGNPFLIPVLSFAFACLPFAYAKRTISLYDTQVKEELETALSIITTSYIRNDDIVAAVSENTEYLKPPVRTIFEGFVTENKMITPDIKDCIKELRTKIKNEVFVEWCDSLIACQDDRTLKDTLMPVVAKLTDVRIVNNDLKTMMSEVRKEYLMMVMLVVVNVPLLYLLNRDWYSALVDTIPGKLVMAVCAVTIAITAFLMAKYTQPIEYKR